MPDEQSLPPGPRRDLAAALHDLYELAGKPAARTISGWIRDHDGLPGTLSHEGVSTVLRGTGVPRWANLESLVRVLVMRQCVGASDVDVAVMRIHTLWRVADGGAAPAPSPVPAPALQAPEQEAIARWDHPRLGIVEFRDRQTVIEIFKGVGGFDDQS
jgi:hypothetical protein